MHYDLGTNYYVILSGEIVVNTALSAQSVRGPVVLLFDSACAFGISQTRQVAVEILVWIWRDKPVLSELRPEPGGFLALHVRARSVKALTGLHVQCRNEVALADSQLPRTLAALRDLLEVEILRGDHPAPAEDEVRWKLAQAWMAGNLAIHAPVPALCDYLRMSPSTLHRFFRAQTGMSPGSLFPEGKSGGGAAAHPRGRMAGQGGRLSSRLPPPQRSQPGSGGKRLRQPVPEILVVKLADYLDFPVLMLKRDGRVLDAVESGRFHHRIVRHVIEHQRVADLELAVK